MALVRSGNLLVGSLCVAGPLETGAAHYSGDPYHWAVTHLTPGKETRWSTCAPERVHPYRPTQPPSVLLTDELLRELRAIHVSTV